jgi:hypothetical protein
MNILEALDHPALFGPFFKTDTWRPWRVFLAALSAPQRVAEAAGDSGATPRACGHQQCADLAQVWGLRYRASGGSRNSGQIAWIAWPFVVALSGEMRCGAVIGLPKAPTDRSPQPVAHPQRSRRAQRDDQSVAVVAGGGGVMPGGHAIGRPAQDFPGLLDQIRPKSSNSVCLDTTTFPAAGRRRQSLLAALYGLQTPPDSFRTSPAPP